MTTDTDHSALLDQLQAQVNSVLEHTGRVFAAMNANPKERPIAQIAKLQAVLPVAEHRFHDALDQLENELQLTMLVMRRDLAVCRERSGQAMRNPALAQPAASVPMQIDNEVPREVPSDAKPAAVPSPEVEHTQPVDDIVMEDAKPSQPEEVIIPDAKPAEVQVEEAVDAKPQQPSLPDANTATDDAKPPTELHVDTKPQPDDQDSKPPEDEKVPDTAAETNNDLDSLFNDDAMSAGGMATDGGDFNFDQDDGNIDFGDFGQIDNNNGDNDNISSLLPGLEDYANTQSNEVDLDQLFNLNSTDDNGMNTQGAGEQGDSFEDLLAGFDGETGDDGQNTAGNQEFDFDSLFK